MDAEMDGVVGRRLDLFGPTVGFLTPPSEAETFCVLRGTIPPGGSPCRSIATLTPRTFMSSQARSWP